MVHRSAGVLLYRWARNRELQVLLVHPGGPLWSKRDTGAWQIPKGLIEPGEDIEDAARREAQEELGAELAGSFLSLGEIRQSGGKIVHAFALNQALNPADLQSNMFEMEWPRGSGRRQSFPEIDAARWMTLEEADAAILPSQRPLLHKLRTLVDAAS